MPQVTTIHGQGLVLTAGLVAQPIEQCFHMGKSTGSSELFGVLGKIQIGERVFFRRTRFETIRIKELLSNNVGKAAIGIANP